ncbi:MAG: TatD family hydrolase [Spirochaetaceae bacterium]|jgi:TatD DNase family protein|nr:TatD family hydrolase [Spirochaetaceae bacterium]
MDGLLKNLTDTHAHLTFGEGVVEASLDALFEDGFGFVLDVGTESGDLAQRMRKTEAYSAVRYAAGVWPHKTEIGRVYENAAELCSQIENAPEGKVAAIGECGFDLRENPQRPNEETALLEMQLSLAQKYALPVIIHSREEAERTIETLKRFPAVTGVIHCFSYSKKEARSFLDMGWYISFAGNLTFKSAVQLRETLPFVPENRLLLETDCPFLAPEPYRGEPCLPKMIVETYKLAAKLRGDSFEEIKNIVAHNAKALFKFI